jgi:tRNA pseudouridine32 synthase/23S rRNA pseudouridine746 synthase
VNPLSRFPTRNGVGASCIALQPGHWLTVLDFLDERFPSVSREEIVARMQRGDVMDEAGAPIAPEHVYRPHQKLFYYRQIEDEPRIPFDEEILFQDDLIVVADKPHFLPVTPGGRYLQESLLVRLKRKLGMETLAPMHRIDRETAGLVVFTLQPETRGLYQALFSSREVHKQYECVAPFRDVLVQPMEYRSRIVLSDHFMRMHETDGPANAETRIEMQEEERGLARYRLMPLTGKKHQLRVHMAALGAPILNDQIYPEHVPDELLDGDYSRPLQLLAQAIAFRDPVTGRDRQFHTRRALLPFAGSIGEITSRNGGVPAP